MSEYFFGCGRGRVPAQTAARVDRIAQEHGASFVTCVVPGRGPEYWFAAPNRGAPFDGETARAVEDALRAVGLEIAQLAGKA